MYKGSSRAMTRLGWASKFIKNLTGWVGSSEVMRSSNSYGSSRVILNPTQPSPEGLTRPVNSPDLYPKTQMLYATGHRSSRVRQRTRQELLSLTYYTDI